MIRRSYSFLILLLFSVEFLSAQEDSTLRFQKDSAAVPDDCTAGFFQRSEQVSNMNKIKLVLKTGKIQTLSAFYKVNQFGNYAEQGLQDLDNDGKKELVLFNYTGGAHCCDEIYIFKNTAPSTYQYVTKLFGGDVCIAPDNSFTFRFYQQLGYFFTCFACAYEDTSDAAPLPIHTIVLKYEKGKLLVAQGDKDLRSAINDNLSKLGEQPYEKIDDTGQDNGLRKEFALNLAVFYYSFGGNMTQTQQLLNKYYKYPDAKKVWAEFVKHLQSIRKQSDF